MTSNSIRSFAGGLIVAASVCGAAYYFGPNDALSEQPAEKPTINDIKRTLTSEGYVIHTDEEWREHLAAAKPVEEKAEEATKETVIYHTILTVSEGMTSIDVGKALERANIIDNAMDFFNEVEKRDLSKALRPGSYEIESGMTLDEIISIIFK